MERPGAIVLNNVPEQIGKFYTKDLGFVATIRTRVQFRFIGGMTTSAQALEQQVNLNVREEYDNQAGVAHGFIWFAHESDAMHFKIKNS